MSPTRKARPRRLSTLAVAAFVAAVAGTLAPSYSQAHSGLVLRGFGTAMVDGALSSGEWDGAGRAEFAAAAPAADGGGTVPALLLVMNDATTLYLAVRLSEPTLRRGPFAAFEFDNDHDGVREEGDELIEISRSEHTTTFLRDEFRFHCAGSPAGAGLCPFADSDTGADLPPPGTVEGTGAAETDGSVTTFEVSHPLDSSDDAHDFSLHVGSFLGFQLTVGLSTASPCPFPDPTCYAFTSFPTALPAPEVWGDIRITSQNRTPPDAEITTFEFAPGRSGAVTSKTTANVAFTGHDDVIAPTELLFECRLDDEAFAPCTSPLKFEDLSDGRHRFGVRAVDEAGNTDPTPAERNWTVDTAPPTRPKIAGPRRTSSRRPTFRFSSTDEIAGPSKLRFRCSFDTTRLPPCGRRFRKSLSRGRHVLRAQAVDQAGNESPVAKRTVVVR